MSAERLGLDQEMLARLERMSVAARTRVRGTMQGGRRSHRTGASLDFADYRLYTPGDDTRAIDWNAFGRSGKPFVKLFFDERELTLRLWVDASASMNTGGEASPGAGAGGSAGGTGSLAGAAAGGAFGGAVGGTFGGPVGGPVGGAFGGPGGGENKFLYAKRLAACIGYMALTRYDRVACGFFGDGVSAFLPPLRGRGSAHRMFGFLADAAPVQAGQLYRSLAAPDRLPRQPGMTWIFSDFLYESGVQETLNMLQAAKQDVVVVQVLSPEEIAPELSGDLRLVDVETGSGKEVAMSADVLRAYREALASDTESLRRFCRERGMTYALAPTGRPALDWIAAELRGTGVLV